MWCDAALAVAHTIHFRDTRKGFEKKSARAACFTLPYEGHEAKLALRKLPDYCVQLSCGSQGDGRTSMPYNFGGSIFHKQDIVRIGIKS